MNVSQIKNNRLRRMLQNLEKISPSKTEPLFCVGDTVINMHDGRTGLVSFVSKENVTYPVYVTYGRDQAGTYTRQGELYEGQISEDHCMPSIKVIKCASVLESLEYAALAIGSFIGGVFLGALT